MTQADDINTIAAFCGVRDVNDLTQTELKAAYGIDQADVCVLFGGSIISGVDIFAEAINNKVAKHFVIVGGAGHTTDTLRTVVKKIDSSLNVSDKSEAEIFQEYLHHKYQLKADFLETKSTNCGNNITYLLELLQKEHIDFTSIILMQDASMMRRMSACLKKYVTDKTIINFATYQATVKNDLTFKQVIPGMWEMNRYISLLMGEIPRLHDDKNGYGPQGKNFIAHQEIPEHVLAAYKRLSKTHSELIRKANPKFS